MIEELRKYIETTIYKEYQKNDKGHDINHIKYVTDRCLELSKNNDVDFNILYVAAAYHDIGHHINPKEHEIISARIMYNDLNLRKYLSNENIDIIKEAIEDHRASSNHIPRSIYGKILASADRNINVDIYLNRTYNYTKNHNKDLSFNEIMEKSYKHMIDKYGKNGYAKSYIIDDKYKQFLKDIDYLINNKEVFINRYKKNIR